MSEPTFVIFAISSDAELVEMAKCLVSCSVKINTRSDGLLRILTNIIDSRLDLSENEGVDDELESNLGPNQNIPELTCSEVWFIPGFSKSEISSAIVHFENLAKAAQISTNQDQPLTQYAVLPMYEQMLTILNHHLVHTPLNRYDYV